MIEMLADAADSVGKEPGCLRFDLIQDPKNENRIWLYEVYRDEAAFGEHLQTPHFLKWKETALEWLDEAPLEPVLGGSNIWPADANWK